jgi:hypothetical protein
MGKKIFAFTYHGSGRFTGQTCESNHRYLPPEPPEDIGWWVGEGCACAHPETDGIIVEESEFERQMEWQLHDFCHDPARPSTFCRYCRQAGWV